MAVVAASAFEWVKALSPVVAALLAIGGATLVTSRVSHRYEQGRKQREFDRETTQELAALYGQIFAVWRAWDVRCRFPTVDAADHADWTLLMQAVDAEGRLEALLIRIVADRPLRDPDDLRILAGLRLSFKVVRRAIREDKPLGWRRSIDREYSALKAYAASTAALLSADRVGPAPDAVTARAVFQKIASGQYEPTWAELAIVGGVDSSSAEIAVEQSRSGLKQRR
jgi:hypothetical protein